MKTNTTFPLARYPFARLVVCLIAGILLQWYLQFSISVLLLGFIAAALVALVLEILPLRIMFRLQWLQGVVILLLLIAAGGIATYVKDIRNNPNNIVNVYHPKQEVLLTIGEPLVDKPNSYKAQANVTAVMQGGKWQPATGEVLLYFYKGKTKPKLNYGNQLILHAVLEPIKNSGNPGAFDYKQYCLLHGISYQAFVYPGQYENIWIDNKNTLQGALYNTRDFTISSIQKTIPGEKEQGVAEALLIGYRDKLDPDLVQAYTNAGVIHIIAISGMHLGMIYLLLLAFFSRLPVNKANRFIEFAVVVLVLWLFTLLAGAAPSIVRAAVMFSIIALCKLMGRRTNTYNTLAASAFVLLVYNPFYLWDAGFMLSYAAVLSIVAFFKSIYNWFYIKNKLGNFIWKAMAVNISAQILTLPIVLFYFHQFPNMFLLANLVAVPLSEIILYAILGLIAVVWIPVISHWVGIAVYYFIIALNSSIEWVGKLPLALLDNIYADTLQTLLFYALILAIAAWLLRKSSRAFITSLSFLTVLVGYTAVRYININHTQKLIVYNIPHQTGIDIMQGRHYQFIGDSILQTDNKLNRYNLKPSRILNGVYAAADSSLSYSPGYCFTVNHSKILLLDSAFKFNSNLPAKTAVDVVILAKNPKVSIFDVASNFTFKQLVFDGSNRMWKIRRWKKDCDSLHLRFHSVPEQGAFVMNL